MTRAITEERDRQESEKENEEEKNRRKKKAKELSYVARTKIKKTYRHIIGLCGSGSNQIETDIGYSASMVASLASPSRVLGSDYQIR